MDRSPVLAGGLLPARTNRQVARIVAGANIELTAISARRQIELAKVETLAEVAEVALVATAHISTVEALLGQQAPHAQARLKYVADGATAAIATQLMKTARGL